MGLNSSVSLLDGGQIVKRAFDGSNDAIRIVPAEVTSMAIELDAADGDSVLAMGSSDGTSSGTLRVLRADSNGRLDVLSNRTQVSVTPVVSLVAYTANDQVGGIQTIASIVRTGVGTASLESIVVLDAAKQKAALTILLFNALPTVASVDNGAVDISDAEMLKCIGHVNVAAADYVDVASSSVASVKNIALTLKPASGTSLYAVVFTTGTPTYAAVGDLVFKYGVFQD